MFKKCDICGDMTVKMHKTEDGIICHKCFCFAGFNLGMDVSDRSTDELKNMRIIDTEKTVKCAKCGSSSISAHEKGFGVGKAVVGAALAGPLGLMAGNAGAKKVFITCLNCGHRWQAGKK